jgi:hypothetical protein
MVNSTLVSEIIYESDCLKLFKNKQSITLLQSSDGHFKTIENKMLGNVVKGYKSVINNKVVIEPLYNKIIQVFPDNRQ